MIKHPATAEKSFSYSSTIPDEVSDLNMILNLVRGHNRYVSNRVDLIASNSWISHFVRLVMTSSLPNNYCIGLPGNRLYGGCAYIDMIERDVVRLARQIFGMERVIVQFLSGMQANIGAYNAILKPGDVVISAQAKHGGHYSHGEQGPLRFFSPKVVPVPFEDECYNINLPELEKLMEQTRPTLLIVGWSEFLFPHDLPTLRKFCDTYNTRLMYDMSHVAGLIAGNVFQPDVAEFADIITSSTGKSLHAPDHGLVMFHDESLEEGVLDAVMPLLTSNTHAQEMAALGVALAEHSQYGHEYAQQVVRNAKALGQALHEQGLGVLYSELGFTESHTVLVEFPAAETAVTLLDRAGLLANACQLPWDPPEVTTGLRLGTQVVTRRGMREEDMGQVAEAVTRVIKDGEEPEAVGFQIIRPLAEQFQRAAFSFDFHFPLHQLWYDRPFSDFQVEQAGDVLKGLIPFANCSTEEIESLVPVMNIIHCENEQIIFEAGDDSEDVWFIYEGSVDVLERRGDASKRIAILGEGSHFGELGVMEQQPRSYAICARAGTRLLHMTSEDFLKTLERLPEVRAYFRRYISSLDG